jgi:hypothetical protein
MPEWWATGILAGREQHPPIAAMSEATHGGAASPQDVQSQNPPLRNEPKAQRLASAQNALEQARDFDRSGQETQWQETQCMDAVARVKHPYSRRSYSA